MNRVGSSFMTAWRTRSCPDAVPGGTRCRAMIDAVRDALECHGDAPVMTIGRTSG
jgi:hypothetical protein